MFDIIFGDSKLEWGSNRCKDCYIIMMKKEYEKPILELLILNVKNILTDSGETTPDDNSNGDHWTGYF